MVINRSIVIPDAKLGGKGLAARADLKGTDLIIKVADPYLLIVENASLEEVCSQCLQKEQDCCQEGQKLAACPNCDVPRYCSPGCQTLSWDSIHGLECLALKAAKVQGKVVPTPTRALMQILLIHKRQGPPLTPDPRWRDLTSNLDSLKQSQKRWDGIVMQVMMACELARMPFDQTFHFAAEVLCRMTTNAFRVMPMNFDKPVGLCFEPLMALANHSCSPNAIIVFDGRKVMLQALNPIKKDEQIFISYVNNTERRAIRQSSLLEGYFFTCNCAKCLRDHTPYQSWTSHHMKFPTGLDALFYFEHDIITSSTDAENDTEKVAAASLTDRVYTDVDRFLKAETDSTIDKNQNLRLQAITRAFGAIRGLWQAELFALPPYPAILKRLYLYRIDTMDYSAALSVLIFIHLRCDIYTYPQLHHPSNIAHLLTIATLCMDLASQVADPGGAILELERIIYPTLDFLSAAQVLLVLLRKLVPFSHGEKSEPMKMVKSRIAWVEHTQRSPGGVGNVLAQWGNGGQKPPFVSTVLSQLRNFGSKDIVEQIIRMGLPAVINGDGDLNFQLF